MKKKVIGPILCFVFIIVVVFGTLCVIDHHRMENNEPILFSTWGKKYAPPLESFSAVMCSAQQFINSRKDGVWLEITLDDEKHTKKKLAIKDENVIKKLNDNPIEYVIGVNLKAAIPDKALEGKADYYIKDSIQLLIDYDDYDKYFEIVDVSFGEAPDVVKTYDAKVTTTDRVEALKGADGVVCTVLAGDVDVWKYDITIPKKYGVDINVGDTRGPAGIFRALRTIPLMLDICADIEKYCPDAIFLNYTNPMAMLCHAMQEKFPNLNINGLCHSAQGTAEMLASVTTPYTNSTAMCVTSIL